MKKHKRAEFYLVELVGGDFVYKMRSPSHGLLKKFKTPFNWITTIKDPVNFKEKYMVNGVVKTQ